MTLTLGIKGELIMSNNANQSGNNGNEKLFTQQEVDNIVRDRLERERKRYSADADAMGELNKQVASLQAELSQLKEDKMAQAEQLKSEKIKSAIIDELTKGNAINTSSLLHVFTGGANISEDGTISVTGEDGNAVPVADGVASWLKLNPWARKNVQNAGSGEHNGYAGYNSEAVLREAFGLVRKD